MKSSGSNCGYMDRSMESTAGVENNNGIEDFKQLPDEVVAAISAAIYAANFSRPGYRLIVRNIVRSQQVFPPIWSQIGKMKL